VIDEEAAFREQVQKLNPVADFELRKFVEEYEEVDHRHKKTQSTRVKLVKVSLHAAG